MARLDGQIAIVTGAAAGIGKAIAARIVQEGGRVAIADVNKTTAQQVCQELGPAAMAVAVDVADKRSVLALVEQVQGQLGPVDLLVNSAGISQIVPFLELDEATWQRHVQVNLTGTFLCCQAVLGDMAQRRRGKIINISSQSGKTGGSHYEAYCASKFGVIGLTQSLALEFAPLGITVNAICPGIVMTELWRQMLPAYAAKRSLSEADVEAYLLSRIPQGRFCSVDDVAATACFLASSDADYITGQAINLSGGAVMH